MAIIQTVKGLVLFNGASAYDGAPIIAILCKSKNKKTGNSTQLWIMREDLNPIEASRIGSDYSVCGNCTHRGEANPTKQNGWADGRTCYVNLMHAPMQVFKAYKRGIYTPATTIEQVREFIGNDFLRIGAYGDPGALPIDFINQLQKIAVNGFTSYTHGFTVSDLHGEVAGRYSMVSVENKAQAVTRHIQGFRTFRVIPIAQANDKLLQNEIMCPSDRGVQCRDCKLCNGQKSYSAKSIAIIAHGTNKNKVK